MPVGTTLANNFFPAIAYFDKPRCSSYNKSMTIDLLRQQLRDLSIDGFIIPRADEHQGEYVPPSAERLAYVTGFTGSAGCAVILQNHAALFTDGRYTIQAKKEIDGKQFEIRHISDNPPADWIAEHAAAKAKIGYDPWLHTPDELERYKKRFGAKSIMLVPVAINPVDAIWQNRPKPPLSPVTIQPAALAGASHQSKREKAAKSIQSHKADAFVLTQSDSITWLLNIRGNDVPFNPVSLCFAIIDKNGLVDLYIEAEKISPAVKKHLGNQIAIFPKSELLLNLKRWRGKKIGVDPGTVASKITDGLRDAGAELYFDADPCLLPRALKNKSEQDGMRRAHRRDGAAMVKFLYWLSRQKITALDEISAAEQLQKFRAGDPNYRGDSFATICGFAANGAIVHYRAGAKTKSKFRSPGMLLLDSGAQYADGTTDITRTLFFGTPNAEHKDRYTRVLKGHIALSRAQFPANTSGSQLDSLARQYLWQAGLDYDHGTGHGVGCYLCVHEGPQRISRIPNRVPILPGMVISNEPGYYKAGEYGIRIENLIMAQAADKKSAFVKFETLTMAPYEKKLIQKSMLSADEIRWVNDYHRMAYNQLRPLLSKAESAWLRVQTKPL